jgi:nucleotide-binding universal stress UspA family protein
MNIINFKVKLEEIKMKILVPTAGPGPAAENANYILEIAQKMKADVVVLHILDLAEKSEGNEALKIFQDLGDEMGVDVKTILKEGNVVPTIVDSADDESANLIIMGASKGRIVAEWIVADVLEKSNVPIVIIPYGYNR